jgi:hypothetical protein
MMITVLIIIIIIIIIIVIFIFIYFSSFFPRNICYSNFKRFDSSDKFYFLIELFNRAIQF